MDFAIADLILLRNALDFAILYEDSGSLLGELYSNLHIRICKLINIEKDKFDIL